MTKTEKLSLIEGVFSEEEARDILMNIFLTKINFHAVKNFSSEERFGKQDETAIKRIPELKKEVVKLKEILSEAQGKQLAISATINISFKND